MTHFEDLSPYAYFDEVTFRTGYGWITYRPGYPELNVGWLDAPHDFPTGPVPPWFPDALLDIVAGNPVNLARGFHRCTLCPGSLIDVEHRGEPLRLGSFEIRVPADAGIMFAAPSLVWHYVTAHGYRPPDDFVEAVRKYDPGGMTEPSPWIPEQADRERSG